MPHLYPPLSTSFTLRPSPLVLCAVRLPSVLSSLFVSPSPSPPFLPCSHPSPPSFPALSCHVLPLPLFFPSPSSPLLAPSSASGSPHPPRACGFAIPVPFHCPYPSPPPHCLLEVTGVLSILIPLVSSRTYFTSIRFSILCLAPRISLTEQPSSPFPCSPVSSPYIRSSCLCAPSLRPGLVASLLRTPCIGLAPSAMARMTAVAMLLPGLLAAVLPAIPVIVSIMLRARDAWPFTTAKDVTRGNQQVNHPFALPSASLAHPNATAMCQNAACGPPTPAHTIASSLLHAHALNVPLHFLRSLPSGANHLLVLYSVISTLIASLMALLWGMGVTHTQVRAWVHQRGLAVTDGLMKLKSATKCRVSPTVLTMLQQRGIFPLLHNTIEHARTEMERLGKAVGTVVASMGGTHGWKEAMEMRMRVLGVQLEETRRVLEEAERGREIEIRGMRAQVEERERELGAVLAAAKREVNAVKGELVEHKQSTTLQLEEAERRRVAEMRGQVEERERELGVVKGEVNAVKGEVNAVKGEVNAVKGEVNAVKGEVNAVKGEVNAVKGEVNAVKGEVNAVKGEVNAVKGEVNAVKGEVNAVKGEVNAVKGEVNAVKGEVNAVKGEVNAVKGEVNAVKGEVNAVKGEVNAVKGEVNAVKGEVNAVKGEVNAVKGEVNAVKGEVNAVKGEVNAVKGEVNAVKGEVNAVKGEVTTVQGEVNAVKAEVNAVKGEVNAVKGEVAAVKSEMAEQKQSTTLQLEEAERRRVAEMTRQVEESELAALQGEVNAVRGELAEHKEVLVIDLKIKESEGDQKTAWQRIKAASQRTALELENLSNVSDAMLAHVSTMTQLSKIVLYHSSGFSAEGIRHLYKLPKLETLDLRGTEVSDSALEGIGALTSLEDLLLHQTKVTDAGLPHLTGLSSLELLGLGGCKGVTNAGMVHVGRLTQLENLNLEVAAITDAGLQQLTGLTSLRMFRPPEGGCLKNEDARRRIRR
ncbi:unnamed protein product [Closterium sp. Yama58-4]|nr:unnamed protein product [Closterium sp. Yama58-4]